MPISLSSDVAPEFREYDRASTTVINAAIQPIVEHYLERIERRLADAGVAAKLLVMQSSGGVFTFEAAASGRSSSSSRAPPPASSPGHLGGRSASPDVISFDMGGTTAKVGLVRDGRAADHQGLPRSAAHAAAGLGRHVAPGYPIRTPVIDLAEIGAGGGSIAWVDSGGRCASAR